MTGQAHHTPQPLKGLRCGEWTQRLTTHAVSAYPCYLLEAYLLDASGTAIEVRPQPGMCPIVSNAATA